MAQIFKPSANSAAKASLLALGLAPWVLFYAGSTITRSSSNTKVDVPLNQPVPFSHKHHVEELGIDCRYCHTAVEKTRSAGIPATETCMSCHSQIWTNSPILEPVRKSYESGLPITWVNGDVGWNQVNKAPEFVYFDHSIHIDRGVSCNTCHGPVQQMHITWKGKYFSMAWCLECHREPEKFLYEDAEKPQEPRQKVFDLYRKVQNGDKLTPRERAVVNDEAYKPSAEELEEGKKLVEAYQVKKQQLTDCWTCHR